MATTERVRSRVANDVASAKEILFELQVEQHHHDEVYHREIARLSMHQRLNHMALHFAKYAGKIASADGVETVVRTYTDTLIIALSTSNILNIEVWSILEGSDQDFPGLLAFGRSQAKNARRAMDEPNELLRETVVAAGRIAAACEKIDHLEEISFRLEIKGNLAALIALALAVLATNGIDPAQAVRDRLKSVKSRQVLHGRI